MADFNTIEVIKTSNVNAILYEGNIYTREMIEVYLEEANRQVELYKTMLQKLDKAEGQTQ